MPNVKKISKRNKTIVVLAITIIMVLLCYLVFNLISIQDSKKMQIKVLEITPYTETSSIVGQDVEKAYAVATINGKKYINKLNTVKLLLQGTDENYSGSSLTANNIVVKVGGNTITPTTKTLSSAQSITNGVQYELTISGITGNGELTVEVAADTLTDKSNNKNILTKFDSEIIVDNSAPTLSSIKVTSPVAGTYTTGENVTIVATFNESVKGSAPVLGLKFGNTASKGTVKAGTISGSTITYTYTITAGDNGVLGINTFSGTALTDMVGNIWSSTVLGNTGNAITADTTAPNAPTITAKTADGNSYTSDNWTKQDVTITASSSDNISGVKQIEYSYDNSTWETDWGTTMTTSGTTSTISGTWSSDYNTTIYVRAIDKLGNISGVSSIVLKIDKTAPSTTSVEIKNVTTTGYDVYVYGVTDSGSGVNRIQFPTWTETNGQDDIQSNWQTDSKSTGVKQSDGTTWVYHVNVADHNNEYGKYITHVYVYDNSGNNQYIKEETATVPAVNITYDNNYLENNLWTDTDDLVKYRSAGTSLSNKTRTQDTSVMHGYINEFTMNAGTSGGVYYVPSAKLTVGKTYTWSAYVKTSSSKTLKIGQEQNGQKTVNVTTSWQKITHTYTAVDNTKGYYSFVFYVTGGSTWTEGDKLYVHSLEIKEGDSLDISTVQKGYGAALGTLNTPTRTGYTFAGWFTASTGGTQISSTTTTPESDTTYYAHWTINSYNVTYNSNMQMSSYSGNNGFTITQGTEDAGSYYRATFTKTSGTANEWRYIKFPSYQFEEGATYTIHIKIRMQNVTNASGTAIRHSALSNDYWTSGRQQVGFESATVNEWKEYTLTRKFEKTYTNGSTTYNTAPLIEIYTGNLALSDTITSRSLTFDFKDVWVDKVTTTSKNYNEQLGTLPTDTRTGYNLNGWYTQRNRRKSN